MANSKEHPPADTAYTRAIRDILATPKAQKQPRFDARAASATVEQLKMEQTSSSYARSDQTAKRAAQPDAKTFDPDKTPARFKFDDTIIR